MIAEGVKKHVSEGGWEEKKGGKQVMGKTGLANP